MKLYLDASALVPLFVADAHTSESRKALAGALAVVSDFAMAEFSSAVARRVRMGIISASDASSAFAALDAWVAKTATRETLASVDVIAAIALVRRLDLGLRTPDALNIVIAQRCSATLLTFDAKMAAAARTLGLAVTPPLEPRTP